MRTIEAELEERFKFGDSSAQMRFTQDGYLIAMPRIARTGIQLYTGDEMGMPEKKVVRVYRPEEQVFDKQSMRSFAFKPVTDDHPGEDVTAENWSDLAIGQTGSEIARDGEYLRVPMMVMDHSSIKDIKSGKRELSAGYSTKIVMQDGVAPNGEAYDAIMTDIRANHLAVVAAARGGPKLRIGDSRQFHRDANNPKPQETKPMTTRTILVDGISVTMEDQQAAIVERAQNVAAKALADSASQIATLSAQLQNAKDEAAKTAADAKTAGDAKDAQIATLGQQLKDAAVTPEKLDALVAERTATFERARAILGDSFDPKGKTDMDVRRATVAAKLGDTCKGWDDNMIRASFDTLTAGAGQQQQHQQQFGGGARQIANAFADGFPVPTDANQKRDAAISTYSTRLTNAYKGAGAQQ